MGEPKRGSFREEASGNETSYTRSSSSPCIERGARKENKPGVFLSGRLKRMEIPRFINGLVKSIMCSRTKVIVSGATAETGEEGGYGIIIEGNTACIKPDYLKKNGAIPPGFRSPRYPVSKR